VKVEKTTLRDVLVLTPKVHGDGRGFFLERYNRSQFLDDTGVDPAFVQDNHSGSTRGVLRGLHYQIRQPQGKLIWAISGEIFDIAVDLRASSPTFGGAAGLRLSAANRRMAWIPPGFAHGFLVLSETAEVMYKATDFYAPEHERTLLWNDPELGIEWPLAEVGEPVLSEKDRKGRTFPTAERFE